MKKSSKTRQKLNLSRETLRRLQASQLEEVVGGETYITCPLTECWPCASSLEARGCATET